MSEPLISVIIPIYNTSDYLETSIGSVIAQDYNKLEIILVDDGSTDNSLEICNELAKKDKRIIVISKENGGVSSARNCGIDAANGEYIGFVDSDDYIDSDMYSLLLANALENDTDISQCEMHKGIPCPVSNKQLYDSNDFIKQLMLYSSTSASLCNKLYSAELFKSVRLDSKFPVAEDILCNYHLLKKAKNIIVSSDAKYHYAFRSNSCINSSLTEKHFRVLDVFDYILSSESDAATLSYCIIGKVKASLDLTRRIFLSKSFKERYPDIRSFIVSEAKDIIFSHKQEIGFKLKIQVLLISVAPWLYKLLLRLKYKSN